MNWREKISWFIHQKIVGRLYAVQFYVTALNTFDGNPPGIFGIEDAKRVTHILHEDAEPLLKTWLPFGLMGKCKALAKSFVLMTIFWSTYAKNLEREMERQKKEKQRLVAFLLKKNIPLPLIMFYNKRDVRFLRRFFKLNTLQDLILYVEQHKALPGGHFLWQMSHWIIVYDLGLEELFLLHVTMR